MISDLAPLGTGDGIPTMSSLKIAEITGKQHGHVMRDIRSILVDLFGEGGISKFGDTHTNPQNGQAYPIFQLPERELLVLLTGYSATLRAKVIDQWQEMKAQIAAPSLPEMLRLAASAMEENDRLKITVSEQFPKVEFFDRVTESATDCSMAVAAQVCKLPYGQNTLYKKLRELGVLISGGSRHNLPKQYAIEQGLFLVTEAKFLRDNETEICFTTKVTQKGIAWIIKHLGKQEVAK